VNLADASGVQSRRMIDVSVIEQMSEAQERILKSMESAQEQIIDVNRRAAEAMSNRLAEGDRLSVPTLPGSENLPSPDEFIDRYFDFTAKMAEANRSFYKEMVSVWAPAEADTAKNTAKNTAKSTSNSKAKAKRSTKAA
jgi:hypothetical protein